MPHRRSLSAFTGLALVPLCAALLAGQAPPPVRDSVMINRSPNPVLAHFRFRSIGPASMGGRVDDIEVAPSDPNVIYVGYATGGVFKSDNNGTTFTPVFETYGSASIGDIAIHPTNANVVYIGTGEANNRQTSSVGDGIYKSEDGGKTFSNVGLKETQTIARIVIDPKSPEVVYVAAPGHLFGPSPDGGVYKTTDGGKSWNKIKYIDENTGFTDIVMDPSNSRVLYAASYQRRRSGCCYNGGGPGSALWKSDNSGRSWDRLSANGLPSGVLGRIALSVSQSNPNVVYAQIEAGAAAEAEAPARGAGPGAGAGAAGGGAAGGGGGGGAGGGRAGGYDWCDNAGPGHGFGGGRGGRGGGAADTTNRTPPTVDANRSGIFRSDNKGKSWTVVSNCDARPLYFSQIRVDPSNEQNIYVAGVHMAKSLDGGKTFLLLDNAGGFFNMGEDQHAIWVDPRNGNHILRGNDAGFMVTWDQGKTWEYVRTMATALSYWVTADMGHPYYVYTGLQDNDSWAGASGTRGRIGLTGQDWFHLTGGDGFQTAVDPTDFHIIYSSSQDGSVSRVDLKTGRATSIRPVPPPAPATAVADSSRGSGGRGGGRGGRGGGRGAAADSAEAGAPSCVDGRVGGGAGRGGGGGGGGGGRGGGTPNVINGQPGEAYRFNWNTPLLMSPHNPSTIWIGGNRLFKSVNRGEKWIESADLTKHIERCDVNLMGVPGTQAQLSKNDGVTAYGTITAISESPVMPGVVWAGTDDGNLDVSRDDGATFTNVAANLPGLPHGALNGAAAYWIVAHRRVAFRHGDGVRRRGRTSLRRSQAVHLRHARLWQDVPEYRGHAAAIRQRAGRERGPEEQEPALRRHRVRDVHLPRRGCALGEVHDQLSHGAHGRHSDSSARRGRDRRDARAESVDRGRRHAAAAVHAGGRVRGRHLFDVRTAIAYLFDYSDGHGRRRRSTASRARMLRVGRRSATTSSRPRTATSSSRS